MGTGTKIPKLTSDPSPKGLVIPLRTRIFRNMKSGVINQGKILSLRVVQHWKRRKGFHREVESPSQGGFKQGADLAIWFHGNGRTQSKADLIILQVFSKFIDSVIP